MKDEEQREARIRNLNEICSPKHFTPSRKEKYLLNTLGIELLKITYMKQNFEINDPYAKLMLLGS
jgi:hypothetical protein